MTDTNHLHRFLAIMCFIIIDFCIRSFLPMPAGKAENMLAWLALATTFDVFINSNLNSVNKYVIHSRTHVQTLPIAPRNGCQFENLLSKKYCFRVRHLSIPFALINQNENSRVHAATRPMRCRHRPRWDVSLLACFLKLLPSSFALQTEMVLSLSLSPFLFFSSNFKTRSVCSLVLAQIEAWKFSVSAN